MLMLCVPKESHAAQILYHASYYTSGPCGDIVYSVDVIVDDQTNQVVSVEECYNDPCGGLTVNVSPTVTQNQNGHVTGISGYSSCSDNNNGNGCSVTIYTSQFQANTINAINLATGR